MYNSMESAKISKLFEYYLINIGKIEKLYTSKRINLFSHCGIDCVINTDPTFSRKRSEKKKKKKYFLLNWYSRGRKIINKNRE